MSKTILLRQHVGAPCEAVVSEGDTVKAGTLIAVPKGLGANIYASVSGVVTEVTGQAVVIREDGKNDGFVPMETDPADLLGCVTRAGVVGMGGAGFPTAVKLKCDVKGGYLLVNAAECEPLLAHNMAQIREKPEQTIRGIRYCMQICHAGKAVIAIKAKHEQEIAVLEAQIGEDPAMSVHLLADLYPMGEERAVVREVLGKLLPPTELPLAAGAVVINVETVLRVAEAIEQKRPVITKNLTVAGKLKRGTAPQVFWDVPVGTTVGEVLEMAGGIDGEYGEIIMGGPFTGKPVSLDTPVTKTTGGLLVTEPFEDLKGAKLGLLLCACGGNEERMRDLAAKLNGTVVCVQTCRQAADVRGTLKCENPGNCPGQAQKCLNFKKAGCTDILIGNCSDCTNTVMGSAPKLGLRVHHQTDHVFRTVGMEPMRYLTKSKKAERKDKVMSISAEYAAEHTSSPAVLCCRAEAGTVLTCHNLEDPAIFDELVESGLLKLEGALTIGQVIGATLTKTSDSLTPLTADLIDAVRGKEAPEEEAGTPEKAVPPAPAPLPAVSTINGGVLKIHISEGKGIDIELPVNAGVLPGPVGQPVPPVPAPEAGREPQSAEAKPQEQPEKVVRTLTRKHYRITQVRRGPETKIEGTVLYIREGIEKEACDSQELVLGFELDIITPDQYHTYSNTIMDVQPIAVKEGEDEVGSGTTRVLDGVVMIVTGTDKRGVQIGEFGSSEGYMDENIMWGRPGAPDYGDIFIKSNVTIKEKTNMERPGPLAAHAATDVVTQEIREALKSLTDDSLAAETETFQQVRRPGKKKVVLVKEIMGQGAMHDNLLLPVEPVGVFGAKPNVDLGNVPVVVSPLEVLDGCIHALTCIGPASKEMSRHYWREPLVLEALYDKEIDLCGVILVGSPQINSEKFYVSKRVGMTCEAIGADGAIVTTEGFGNNHIDFASHIEQIGMRGIKVVGMSFCAKQGALVVGNKYMTNMVDNNKSEAGIENEILANNTLCPEDAVRALLMLKADMAGEPIKKAERQWDPRVKAGNMELISNVTGRPVELVKNETSLPMSEKYKKKYMDA